MFDLWVDSCANDEDCRLWCLKGKGSTGLYQTKTRYLYKHNWYYNIPVYHVWINGKRILATTDYSAANRLWNNRRGVSWE